MSRERTIMLSGTDEERLHDDALRNKSVSRDAVLNDISPSANLRNSYVDVVSNFTSPYPEMDPKINYGVIDIYDVSKGLFLTLSLVFMYYDVLYSFNKVKTDMFTSLLFSFFNNSGFIYICD